MTFFDLVAKLSLGSGTNHFSSDAVTALNKQLQDLCLTPPSAEQIHKTLFKQSPSQFFYSSSMMTSKTFDTSMKIKDFALFIYCITTYNRTAMNVITEWKVEQGTTNYLLFSFTHTHSDNPTKSMYLFPKRRPRDASKFTSLWTLSNPYLRIVLFNIHNDEFQRAKAWEMGYLGEPYADRNEEAYLQGKLQSENPSLNLLEQIKNLKDIKKNLKSPYTPSCREEIEQIVAELEDLTAPKLLSHNKA